MAFVIDSSGGPPLPQDAMRRIVEAVDTWRGQGEVFVVFNATSPYDIISVHTSESEARDAASGASGRSYFGPIAPRSAPVSTRTVVKKVGCLFMTTTRSASRVLLLDSHDVEVGQFTVNTSGSRLPNSTDLEAVFLTASGIDKFAIPYLTRVVSAEYAASQRADWITE